MTVFFFFIFLSPIHAQDFQELEPRLKFNIPTLQPFSKIAKPDDAGNIFVSYLPQYISAVYSYLVGIAGIFAVALIMWGGIKWIFAGGDTGKVGEAQKTIQNAVIGLILALGSYLLLFMINPNTVTFSALRLRTVPQETLADDHSTDEPPAGPLPPAQKGAFSSDLEAAKRDRQVSINFSLFGQVDFRIRYKRATQNITKVVIHNGGYTAAGNNATWQSRPAAAHYTIGRDGVIFQHVGEEMQAPHAPGGNKDGIGIELNIGKANGKSCNSLGSGATPDQVRAACTPTDAQYQSLNALLNDIMRRDPNVRKNVNQIVGHCELSGTDGHADPRAFDWSRIGLDNQEKKNRLTAIPNACSWYVPF